METAIILFGDRLMPPSALAEQAKALGRSGVVDYLATPDDAVNL